MFDYVTINLKRNILANTNITVYSWLNVLMTRMNYDVLWVICDAVQKYLKLYACNSVKFQIQIWSKVLKILLKSVCFIRTYLNTEKYIYYLIFMEMETDGLVNTFVSDLEISGGSGNMCIIPQPFGYQHFSYEPSINLNLLLLSPQLEGGGSYFLSSKHLLFHHIILVIA